MNQVFLWSGAILALVYGTLTGLAGLTQIRARKIQPWAALGFLACGLLVIAGGTLVLFRSPAALWVLLAGLLGTHALAVNNGLHMFGKINPSHHLLRLAVSLLVLGLSYLGLR